MLTIALGFAVVPPGHRFDPAVGLRKSEHDANAEAAKIAPLAVQAHDREVDRTWGLPPETVTVKVMETVNGVAERRGLRVSNFGAGRTISSAGLRQMPFAVTLEGPFPAVLATMQDLERPSTKLVVGGVKIAPLSGGAGLGQVTATLAITAFLRGEGL